MNVLSCGPKALNISGISNVISPARRTQKSSQHVRACATGYGAICFKYEKILSQIIGTALILKIEHLRSLSPIMAPGVIIVK